ncbi:MAG: hypothetical protein KDA69_12115 [Planctomycetaceae bacterium]|nr:hypothetical protein [Planctomycetaceae bacterium]MCA9045062.1 hypothetical protein [Planctomycetaceae bacterium]
MEPPPDWAYYLINFLLIATQIAIWSGNFCKLPANWILVANAALYATFFPNKLNGLGFGYGSVVFFIALAILGESLAYASRHRRKLAQQSKLAGLENTLLGAGAGSFVGAISLFWIPLVGLILALAGSVLGAAAGAYLGTLYSRSSFVPQASAESEQPAPESDVDSDRITAILESASRLVTGGFIVLLSSYSSFSG